MHTGFRQIGPLTSKSRKGREIQLTSDRVVKRESIGDDRHRDAESPGRRGLTEKQRNSRPGIRSTGRTISLKQPNASRHTGVKNINRRLDGTPALTDGHLPVKLQPTRERITQSHIGGKRKNHRSDTETTPAKTSIGTTEKPK